MCLIIVLYLSSSNPLKMSKSINVILQKQKPSDKHGIVYIRTIDKGKIEKKSLRIKILENDWKKYFIPKTKQFKNQFTKSEEYNNVIEKGLEDLKDKGNEISQLPMNKKSFIDFWEMYIDKIPNHGTRIKHVVVLNKLKKYLESIQKKKLLFREINSYFVRDLQWYFSTSQVPTSLSNNSVNHYLKVIKSIINKSEKMGVYHYHMDPFSSLTFKKENTIKDMLNDEELDKLLNTNIEDEKLDLVRKMFIFQLFSNGMRVSDLLLLRWSNLSEGRLEYRMFKTTELISIPINLNMGLIIGDLLHRENRYSELINNFSQSFLIDGKIGDWNLKMIEDRLKKISVLKDKMERVELIKVTQNPNFIHFNGYIFNVENETEFHQLFKSKIELLNIIDKVYLNSLTGRIGKDETLKFTDFVFPVLKNEMFLTIDENNKFSKITLEQYKMMKHSTIVYNRQLKKVQEICHIETNLTSHVSRHSFTNHLLEIDNVNLYDISQSLGHKNITITQNYISSGFNQKKVDYLNKELSDRYRKRI